MYTEQRTHIEQHTPQEDGTHCPYCHGELERLERHDWLMSQCRVCGGLWLEGHNLAQTIQQLHLTPLDSDQEFSALGTIVRRGLNRRPSAARLGGSR